MNGIDKITQRIGADTQAEIDRILGDANAQAETIGAKYRAQAEAEDADLLAKGQRAAAEREERLISAAQMEARKSLLTVKQDMVELAYQRAETSWRAALASAPYTLTLWDRNGVLISETKGTMGSIWR